MSSSNSRKRLPPPNNPQNNNKKVKFTSSSPTSASVILSASQIADIFSSLSKYNSATTSENKDFNARYNENLQCNDEYGKVLTADSKPYEEIINNDSSRNAQLRQIEDLKRAKAEYQLLQSNRRQLPAWNKRREIIETIDRNQVVVLCGETGCGKTTQVGQFLLDAAIKSNNGSTFRAICTQPRRLAATSVADRVAHERSEVIGDVKMQPSVGYQIGLERQLPRKQGSILFCTTGILLQFLQTDPFLKEYSHVIIGIFSKVTFSVLFTLLFH